MRLIMVAAAAILAWSPHGLAISNPIRAVTDPVYNRWHQTELERWLDDNNIPHPSASSRQDLYDLVSQHWTASSSPALFQSWQDSQLAEFVGRWAGKAGQQVRPSKDKTGGLADQITVLWDRGWDKLPTDKWGEAKTWLFDCWTDSQIRRFLEYHEVVAPSTTASWTRQRLTQALNDNYGSIAAKVDAASGKEGSTGPSYYPGNWLYDSWTDSELRTWLVSRGLVEPKEVPKSRASLVAAIRRNWLVARVVDSAGSAGESVASAAAAATSVVGSAVSDAQSDGAAFSSRFSSIIHDRQSAATSAASAASARLSSVGAVRFEGWKDGRVREWVESEAGLTLPTGLTGPELAKSADGVRQNVVQQASEAVATAQAAVTDLAAVVTDAAETGLGKAAAAGSALFEGTVGRIRGALGLKGGRERLEDEIRRELAAVGSAVPRVEL